MVLDADERASVVSPGTEIRQLAGTTTGPGRAAGLELLAKGAAEILERSRPPVIEA